MKRFTITLTVILLLVGAGWFAASLFPSSGIGRDASQVSASYAFGDWIVECVSRDKGLPCEMKQSIVDGETGSLLAVLTVVFEPKAERHAFQIKVPTGVSVEPGIDVVVHEAMSPGVAISGCGQNGCFVNALLVDPMLSEMKKGGEGRFLLHDKNKKKIAVPFSLEGFSGAEEKLRQQTKLLVEGHPVFVWTVEQLELWFAEDQE
jgi:invasion protein IalB